MLPERNVSGLVSRRCFIRHSAASALAVLACPRLLEGHLQEGADPFALRSHRNGRREQMFYRLFMPLCLKSETKAEAEKDLRELISASGEDAGERARLERLLHHLGSTDEAEPLELAKYSLERAGVGQPESVSSASV